jgi:hypothetical protein
MMRVNAWYAVLAAMGLLWYECGHDFGVFCYRIVCGLFGVARERALELVPQRATTNAVRTSAACSNRSFIFSVHSTTPKD